jgi:hypothetical protein
MGRTLPMMPATDYFAKKLLYFPMTANNMSTNRSKRSV